MKGNHSAEIKNRILQLFYPLVVILILICRFRSERKMAQLRSHLAEALSLDKIYIQGEDTPDEVRFKLKDYRSDTHLNVRIWEGCSQEVLDMLPRFKVVFIAGDLRVLPRMNAVESVLVWIHTADDVEYLYDQQSKGRIDNVKGFWVAKTVTE